MHYFYWLKNEIFRGVVCNRCVSVTKQNCKNSFSNTSSSIYENFTKLFSFNSVMIGTVKLLSVLYSYPECTANKQRGKPKEMKPLEPKQNFLNLILLHFFFSSDEVWMIQINLCVSLFPIPSSAAILTFFPS